MGIYGAMTTSVSGMRAQSYALENIAGNIANAQTTGFKRIDTSFADLVNGGSTQNRQIAGAVNSSGRSTNVIQGSIESSSVPTYMAINGPGYFVVQERGNSTNGTTTFSGVDLYTRRGDFELDRDGYLVNKAGYYLKGLPLDPNTGAAIGSVPEVVRLNSDSLPATATTDIVYRANLSAVPETTRYNALAGAVDSELLDPGITPLTDIQASQEQDFLDSSVSGGAVTVYDSLGAPLNVQLRWAKTGNVGTMGADTWNLYYLTNASATGSDPKWANVGADFVFDSTGQLTAPTSNTVIPTLTINGSSIPNVTIGHGSTGLTQFANPDGDVRVTTLSQNGLPAGQLVDIGIGDGGVIAANYSNGRQLRIAQIALVTFNAESQLKRLDGGAFQATQESGPAIVGAPAGAIVGSSLEASNTDIADEFSKLIVTQQAYSANSRVITTANEMLRDVLNIIR